jgi:predicted 2-oxoglutarate/Fe(II)-dependent dioxygenase YbiX
LKKLESLEKTKRAQLTLEIFAKIQNLEKNIQNKDEVINLLNYFKLKLAVSYKKMF